MIERRLRSAGAVHRVKVPERDPHQRKEDDGVKEHLCQSLLQADAALLYEYCQLEVEDDHVRYEKDTLSLSNCFSGIDMNGSVVSNNAGLVRRL